MNVHLATLGCRLNEAEQQQWMLSLPRRGFSVVARPEQAELLVLNTCAVTATAARKTRKLAGRLRRRNPAARLVLVGCFVALDPARAAALAGVDLVLDNRDKDHLGEQLARWLGPRAPTAGSARRTLPLRRRRTRAFVKAQDGCRNRCAYCAITIARGPERSRPPEEVLATISELERQGFAEVVLTGVHLGGYGADLGLDLPTLVRRVLARTSIARLRLSSIEPWDLGPALLELWRDRRLCPHLHLPLQSGSDRLLRRMGRRSDRASYARLAAAARAAIDGLVLTSDVIVGFPGENDADFADTLALCREVSFADLHVFCFSPRPGTAAAAMSDTVPRAVARRRSRELQQLAAELKRAALARQLGSVRPVLWEGEGEALDDGRRRFRGLTDNYLRVEAVTGAARDLDGCVTPTALVELVDGDRLRGRPVELPRALPPAARQLSPSQQQRANGGL